MSQAEQIENLVLKPTESRPIEIKRWFDPSAEVGKAKLVKGIFALRNFNGGFFVVGFDDATLQPDAANRPADVAAQFHNDVVQAAVSHYASERFDVTVHFPERDGEIYPVIAVQSGVRSPVAAKRELEFGGKILIRCDDVYFRTLSSNNTVSSARIPHRDWPELSQICFDNREADIGRFFRRHLVGMNAENVRELLEGHL